MKTQIQKILIVLAIALSVNSKAQTTVDLVYVFDSTIVTSCSTPYAIDLSVFGYATGYTAGLDIIDLHCFWGDGTDSIAAANITSSFPDYFQSYGIPHTYYSPGIYTVMIVASGPDGTDDTMYNPPIIVGSGCTTVDGYCYTDNNSNCLFDSGDDTLAGQAINITDASGNVFGYSYTNSSGYYSTSIPSGFTGLQISPSPSIYATICPASGFYTFNSTGSSLSFDFGVVCSASSYDLYASHSFSGVGAPGSNASLSFYAGVYSCTTSPSVITLTLDPNVSYVNMITGPIPTSVVGNVLTWNTSMSSSLYWSMGFYANINILTNTTATIMSSACFNVSISPTSSDLNPTNNSHTWCLLIGGPYDPNSKEVSPAGIGATGDIAPNSELTYTVNFQNTGTAPAINVYVMDTISNNLDMSTFQIVASSHAMNPYFYEGNIIRFDYPNIMLPDSNANEALSHGWVVYKIKTKSGLTNGTQIKNTGHIFFDYNSAIVTNTTLNTINTALSVSENHNELSTLIYPNPAQNQFTVEFGEEVSGLLSVVDISGRVVKTISINKTNSVFVNTDDFSSGLYGLMMPGVKLKQNRVQIIK